MMKRFISIVLCCVLVLGILPVTGNAADVNGVFNKLMDSYTAQSGTFTFNYRTRLYLVSDTAPSGTLLKTLQLAASNFAELGKPTPLTMDIVYGPESEVTTGDVVIRCTSGLGEEGYKIDITSSAVNVYYSVGSVNTFYDGYSYNGLHYALQAVLKMLISNGSKTLNCATIKDAPDTKERIIQLDCARKYWSINWIENLIREASWMNYNALELHITEDQGIRMNIWTDGVDCNGNDLSWICGYTVASWATSYPDPNGSKTYSAYELRRIVELARLYHLEIIPSVDVPGHCDHLISAYADYYADNKGFTINYHGNTYTSSSATIAAANSTKTINASNTFARTLSLAIVEAYAVFFGNLGCTKIDIGCDEITLNDANWATWAQKYGGSTQYDGFVIYTNNVASMLKKHGYSVRAFNDYLYRESNVELDPDIDIKYWQTTSGVSPTQYTNDGRAIYNCHNNYTYYVLRWNSSQGDARDENNYWWGFHHSTEKLIYNEWNPSRMYAYNASSPTMTNVAGGYFIIWGDWAGWDTETGVWNGGTSRKYNLIDRMWSNSVKMWNWDQNSALSYSDYSTYVAKVRHYPGYVSPTKVPKFAGGVSQIPSGVYSVQKVGSDTAAENWTFWQMTNGTYSIENTETGNVFNISKLTSSTNRWFLKDNADGTYDIIPLCANGIKATDEKWVLTLQPGVADGLYNISCPDNMAVGLNVAGSRTTDGANVQIWSTNTSAKHKQFYVQRGADGYYTIIARHSAKAVEVASGSTANGANVQQNTASTAIKQKWIIVPRGEGYVIVSPYTGYVLNTESSAAPVDGVNVVVSQYTASSTQTWKLCPLTTLTSGTYTLTSNANSSYKLQMKDGVASVGSSGSDYAKSIELTRLSGNLVTLYSTSEKLYYAVDDTGKVIGQSTLDENCKWRPISNLDGNLEFVSIVNYGYLNITGTVANNSGVEASGIHTASDAAWVLTAYSHTHSYSETVVAPGCESTGYTLHTCVDCGYTYTDNETEATGHNPVEDPAEAPSCGEAGLTAGFHCADCGAVLVAQETVPAEHTPEVIPAIPATCTSHGLTEGVKCSVCGEILVAQEETPLAEHTAEVIPGKPATCTETGLTEGVCCAECGEILEAQQVTPITDHVHEIIPGEPATCISTGWTDGICCADCGIILVAREKTPLAEHTAEILPAVPSTCSTHGLTEGSYCIYCDMILVAQEEAPLAEHTHEVIPAVPSTCVTHGLTEGVKCSVCGEILVAQEEAPLAEHTHEVIPAVPSTCVTHGLTEGVKCSVCGEILVAQEEAPLVEHTHEVIPAVPSTCVTHGLTEGVKCSVCDTVLVEPTQTELLDHTPVVDEAVDATCTTDGLTEGSHCGVCGEVLEAQKTVAMLGHTEVIDPAVPATDTTPALSEGSHCGVCGEILVAQEEESLIISNIQITDVTSAGYTVSCTVIGTVDKVLFPTWTVANGQDEIIWYVGVKNGNTYSCQVDVSEHNSEGGLYATHIYAYGVNGTVAQAEAEQQQIDLKPTISNVVISDVSREGYTLTCTVDSTAGISQVKFASWTDLNGKDDIAWATVTQSGSTYTITVKTEDHNLEAGKYWTYIYAYDAQGNMTSYAASKTLDYELAIYDVKITNITADGYTVSCKADGGSGVGHVKFPTWTAYNGNDDVVWVRATRSGHTFTYRVNIKDHNYAGGKYITYVYVYNADAKVILKQATSGVQMASSMVIYNAKITDISSTGFTVSCQVRGGNGVSYVKFPTWTSKNGQDDLIWYKASRSGNTFTYKVKTSSHGNATGTYITHIYAYDYDGVSVGKALSAFTVS